MIIQLLCDHKWRDLPNLVVLKIRLNSLGHKVYISSTKDSEAMISIFKPDCVVINNLFSRRNRRLAQLLKKLNVIIILLPTEGAVRPEFKKIMDGDFANYDLIDLILPWSEISAKGIRKRWRFSKERVKVAGYNRLDFYNKKMINIVEKKDIFCSRHDLNPNKPIVTWATQYGYAFLIHKEKYSQHFEQWLRESKETGQSSCWKEIGINPLVRWSEGYEQSISNALRNFTYEEVLKHDPSYCDWAVKEAAKGFSSPQLFSFSKYLKDVRRK